MPDCLALDKAMIGRREFWCACRYPYGHEGSHHDPKRKGHYWTETFRAFEFESGRSKVPTKRKIHVCSKCNKPRRTDGSQDACVCKEIGAAQRQAILFAEEWERQHREETARQLDEDIAWIKAKHAEMIEERCENYQGDW